jgi:hypothetical protein
MKKFLLILNIVLFCSFTIGTEMSEIVNAIKSGNAKNISTFFDNTVEINVQGIKGSYSKSQAQVILNDFFAAHKAQSFTVLHSGTSGAAQYCIGNLKTRKCNFRTTLTLRQKAEKQILEAIKFEL